MIASGGRARWTTMSDDSITDALPPAVVSNVVTAPVTVEGAKRHLYDPEGSPEGIPASSFCGIAHSFGPFTDLSESDARAVEVCGRCRMLAVHDYGSTDDEPAANDDDDADVGVDDGE